MTNYEMVSVMMILSQAVDGLDFSFINLPNFNGRCLYCFKSSDGKIDFTYNPDEDNDISKYFNKVLHLARKKLLPREILDGETKETVVNLLLDKIQSDIRTEAKNMAGEVDDNYANRYAENIKKLFSNYEELTNTLNLTSNRANKNNFNLIKNFSKLYSSLSRQDSSASSFYRRHKKVSDNEFADAIMRDSLPNWVGASPTPINDEVNLARSRALTLAILDNNNFILAYGRSNLDNSVGLTIANRYGQFLDQNARNYFLHERRGKAGETFDLERFIISEGVKNTNFVPPEKFGDQRKAYYDYLADNNSAEENLRTLLASYLGSDRENSNFLTDRIIMDTVILNLASVCGYNINGIYKVDPKLSKSSMSKMFRHNYELAKSDPNAVYGVKAFLDGYDYVKNAQKRDNNLTNNNYPNRAIHFPLTSIISDNEAYVTLTKPDGTKKTICFTREQIEEFKRTHDLVNDYVLDEKVVDLMKLEYIEENYPDLVDTPTMEEIEHYKALVDMYEETQTRKPPRKRPKGSTSLNCTCAETGVHYGVVSKYNHVPKEFMHLYGFDRFSNIDNELVTDFYIQEILRHGNIPGIPSPEARIADYVSFLEEQQPKNFKRPQKPSNEYVHAGITDREFMQLMRDIFSGIDESNELKNQPDIDYSALTQEGMKMYAEHIAKQGDEVPKHIKDTSNYSNMTELERFKILIARWHDFDLNNINVNIYVREYLNMLKQNVSENNLNAGIIRILGLPQDKEFILKYINLIEQEIKQAEKNQGM